MNTAETTPYDPRYDRAQTVEGAKARYVYRENYTERDLEADLERLLTRGEHPDGPDVPSYDACVMYG